MSAFQNKTTSEDFELPIELPFGQIPILSLQQEMAYRAALADGNVDAAKAVKEKAYREFQREAAAQLGMLEEIKAHVGEGGRMYPARENGKYTGRVISINDLYVLQRLHESKSFVAHSLEKLGEQSLKVGERYWMIYENDQLKVRQAKQKTLGKQNDANAESVSNKKEGQESLRQSQREFIEVLQKESLGKLNFDSALEIYNRLHDLSLRHFKMCNLNLDGDVLDKKHERVWNDLEEKISDLIHEIPGAMAPHFIHDPRGATVGIFFNSGAHNSLSGAYKVPLDPERIRELENYDFRDEIQALEDMDKLVGPIRHMSLLIDTNSAAFEDLGREKEVARILEYAADQIDDWWMEDDGIRHQLRDTNGNVVGHLVFLPEEPAREVERNGEVRACLQYKLNDDAYKDDPAHEVAQILRECAYNIAKGEDLFRVFNSSHDWVGTMEISEIPELEKGNRINIESALMRTFVALEGDESLAIGDYCYIVPVDGFVPGRGQGEGKAWLVNAKGEKAPGYEEPQTVNEADFRALTSVERERLREEIYGQVQFEAYEP